VTILVKSKCLVPDNCRQLSIFDFEKQLLILNPDTQLIKKDNYV